MGGDPQEIIAGVFHNSQREKDEESFPDLKGKRVRASEASSRKELTKRAFLPRDENCGLLVHESVLRALHRMKVRHVFYSCDTLRIKK